MARFFVFTLQIAAFLCCLTGQAIGQPCLYNYTIGASALPVVITQSAPVCLICSDTTYNMWNIGRTVYSGIPGALYVLYVTSPATLFISNPSVYCFTNGANPVSSTVHIATTTLTTIHVTEGNTLNLDCTNVAIVSPGAIVFMGQSWFDPQKNLLANISTYSFPSVYRSTAPGNYTCVTRLVSNVNGVTSVTGTATVIVNYPPKITSLRNQIYEVQGRSVQLNCTFENGFPVSTNITWISPSGSAIVPQSRFSIQNTITSTSLTISSLVGGLDNGVYTCTASNSIGSSSSTVKLVVQEPSNGDQLRWTIWVLCVCVVGSVLYSV